ncbi:MAG: hypothetical protein HY226_01195 [Candidatus Vogelbacteria bacterium]|nr:hypothetical protein [Candidatus Vogelbacteria bacterium]
MPKKKKGTKRKSDIQKYQTLEEIIREKGGEAVLPAWFTDDLLGSRKAGISSVFVLYGDTQGLFPNPNADDNEVDYLELNSFLSKIADGVEMAIFYDIASGPQFLSPEMSAKFKKLSGLKEEVASDPDTKPNPVTEAKAKLASKKPIPKEPELCLPLIENVLKEQEKTMVVINSAHFVFPSTANGFLPQNERVNIERIKNWAMDDFIRDNKSIVILISPQLADISPELRRAGGGISSVLIPKPDDDSRATFIATELAATPELKLSTGIKEFTIATQGLNLSQTREIFLRAVSEGKEVDLGFIKKKKNEIFMEEHGDLLEIVEVEHGLEAVGGMEPFKKAIRNIIDDVIRGETRRDWMMLLSDPKMVGKILVINCTNRIDRIDAALKRDGRSDERWLFPMPSVSELEKIFVVMFDKLEKIPTDIKDFKLFAKMVDGVSGANVRKIVKKAFALAGRAGAEKVGEEHLKAAIADFIPNASQKDIDLMHILGILESSSREMLPANTLEIVVSAVKRNLVPDLGQLVDRIKENKIIPGLDEELAKLAQATVG